MRAAVHRLPEVCPAEAYHGIDALEPSPVELAGGGVPAHLVRRRLLPSNETEHVVPGAAESGYEDGPDHPGRAADDDLHARILAAGRRVPAV